MLSSSPGTSTQAGSGIRAELPGIRFSLFIVHHGAWNFLEKLRDGYTGIPGAAVGCITACCGRCFIEILKRGARKGH